VESQNTALVAFEVLKSGNVGGGSTGRVLNKPPRRQIHALTDEVRLTPRRTGHGSWCRLHRGDRNGYIGRGRRGPVDCRPSENWRLKDLQILTAVVGIWYKRPEVHPASQHGEVVFARVDQILIDVRDEWRAAGTDGGNGPHALLTAWRRSERPRHRARVQPVGRRSSGGRLTRATCLPWGACLPSTCRGPSFRRSLACSLDPVPRSPTSHPSV
jgi:hypothetical protein